ncbi:MAG: GGDEF domain-containing protein, partial [Magnetococcales bacterium]|nr:GGDEF domain-containing protein [Magnetococcales bacterium]
VEKSLKQQKSLGLIFVDLDRFKWVNDNLGHGAGDTLLQASAKRIRECLREQDLVARLGGDEFTVIIPDMSQQETLSIARHILHRLNESFLLEGTPTYISGSLGVAFLPQDAQDLGGLLKCADEAMYRSKKAGRNACHAYGGDSFALQRNY